MFKLNKNIVSKLQSCANSQTDFFSVSLDHGISVLHQAVFVLIRNYIIVLWCRLAQDGFLYHGLGHTGTVPFWSCDQLDRRVVRPDCGVSQGAGLRKIFCHHHDTEQFLHRVERNRYK